MKLFKSKKSMLFDIVLVVIAISILFVAFVDLQKLQKDTASKQLGLQALQLVQKSSQGTKLFDFVDYSGEVALKQALYKLQQEGGASAKPCTDFFGFKAWKDSDENLCIPQKTDLINGLKLNMIASIGNDIYSHPTAKFRFNNYDLFVSEDDANDKLAVTGIARFNAEFDPSKTIDYGVAEDCKNLIPFAQQYVGTPYRFHDPKIVTPEQAKSYGTTCVSFVQSVYHNGLKPLSQPRGDGKYICNYEAKVTKLSTNDPDQLVPGDIFSSTSCNSDYGHTGLYVGKGYVSDKFQGSSKYQTFTPDPNGEHVFIHSGRVGYNTFDQLFGSNGCYNDWYIFCRSNECIT